MNGYSPPSGSPGQRDRERTAHMPGGQEFLHDTMARLARLFLLYLLSTAGLIASIFLLGDMTLFYEGMSIVGVIVITNIIVVAFRMHR